MWPRSRLKEIEEIKESYSVKFFVTLIAPLAILALALSSCTQANIMPGEARAIAREVYI